MTQPTALNVFSDAHGLSQDEQDRLAEQFFLNAAGGNPELAAQRIKNLIAQRIDWDINPNDPEAIDVLDGVEGGRAPQMHAALQRLSAKKAQSQAAGSVTLGTLAAGGALALAAVTAAPLAVIGGAGLIGAACLGWAAKRLRDGQSHDAEAEKIHPDTADGVRLTNMAERLMARRSENAPAVTSGHEMKMG